MDVREYSQRLGVIAPEQFQAALDHFGLGKLLCAEPIPYGISKGNVFLTCTDGTFVFRGAPLRPHQFQAERFFVRLLHEQTEVPVPYPFLVDASDTIFGWSYAIMPRMPGLQLADHELRKRLSKEDRRGIARALGKNLALMQEARWAFSGEYDAELDAIRPFESSYSDWITACIRSLLARSREYSDRTTVDDCRWVEDLLDEARDGLNEPFQPCFVQFDYKESNVVVERKRGQWQISGVFDFAKAHVGDGEVDLARAFSQYLDIDPALASEFLSAYLASRPPRPGFAQRFSIYMLLDCLQTWEFCQKAGSGYLCWDEKLTLRQWAGRYVAAFQLLPKGKA